MTLLFGRVSYERQDKQLLFVLSLRREEETTCKVSDSNSELNDTLASLTSRLINLFRKKPFTPFNFFILGMTAFVAKLLFALSALPLECDGL
jgi:hypothetical protein